MRLDYRSCVVASLLVAACSDGEDQDLPNDVRWSSEHFDYYTRARDASVCASITETLEAHRAAVTGYLGIDPAERVDYRKFRNGLDFVAKSDCPAAGACAFGHRIESPIAMDRHELVHAYTNAAGHPPLLFDEGLAQALSCYGGMRAKPQPPMGWREALAGPASTAFYENAGWFAGHLLKEYGPALFMELYRDAWSDASAAEAAERFNAVYGVSLELAWTAAFAADDPTGGCVYAWECAGAPVEPGGGEISLSGSCDASKEQRSLALAEAGLLELHEAKGVVLGVCDPRAPAIPRMTATEQVLYDLPPGAYFLASDTDRPSTARFTLHPRLPADPFCASLPFPSPADKEVAPWSLVLSVRESPATFALPEQPVALAVISSSGLVAEACDDCSATPACRTLGDLWLKRTGGALRLSFMDPPPDGYGHLSIDVLGVPGG